LLAPPAPLPDNVWPNSKPARSCATPTPPPLDACEAAVWTPPPREAERWCAAPAVRASASPQASALPSRSSSVSVSAWRVVRTASAWRGRKLRNRDHLRLFGSSVRLCHLRTGVTQPVPRLAARHHRREFDHNRLRLDPAARMSRTHKIQKTIAAWTTTTERRRTTSAAATARHRRAKLNLRPCCTPLADVPETMRRPSRLRLQGLVSKAWRARRARGAVSSMPTSRS